MGIFESPIMESPFLWPDTYASPMEVSINTIATMVVALLSKVEAPVLPRRVWLDPPPKAEPISAPFPVCSNTIRISAMQTTTCIINKKIVIKLFKGSYFTKCYGIKACPSNQCAVNIRHLHEGGYIIQFNTSTIKYSQRISKGCPIFFFKETP